MKLVKYKRYLKIARDLEYWLRFYVFDREMQRRGIILGLPYWQVQHSESHSGIERQVASPSKENA